MARLVRKTLSFSKSVEMLEDALTLAVHRYNLSRSWYHYRILYQLASVTLQCFSSSFIVMNEPTLRPNVKRWAVWTERLNISWVFWRVVTLRTSPTRPSASLSLSPVWRASARWRGLSQNTVIAASKLSDFLVCVGNNRSRKKNLSLYDPLVANN